MSRETYQARVLRVLLRIEGDLDRPWTLEELAKIASFSPHHFHRIFGALVGESVASYLRRIRLEHAAGQLSATGRPVGDIGREAGYANPEVFTRAFTKRFGVSPSVFRSIASDPATLHPSAAESAAQRVAARWRAALPDEAPSDPAVEIVELPDIRCAFVRATGAYERSGPEAWRRLRVWAKADGRSVRARRRFSVGHDDPAITAPEMLRLDACLELDADAGQRPEHVGLTEIPGGAYARLLHKGPMRKIDRTFGRLYGRWLPDSGREPRAAPPMLEHIDRIFPYGPPLRLAVLLPLRS